MKSHTARGVRAEWSRARKRTSRDVDVCAGGLVQWQGEAKKNAICDMRPKNRGLVRTTSKPKFENLEPFACTGVAEEVLVNRISALYVSCA